MKNKKIFLFSALFALLFLLPSVSHASSYNYFTTSKYKITDKDNKLLTNISNETPVSSIIKDISIPEWYSNNGYGVKVYNDKGTEITEKKFIGTGSTIKLVNLKYGYSQDSMTAIVYGDVTGDGKANVADALAIVKNRLGKKKLTDENYVEAGRLTATTRKNASVPGVADALLIVKATLGKAKIEPYYKMQVSVSSYADLYKALKDANTNLKFTSNAPSAVKTNYEKLQNVVKTYIKDEMSQTTKALVLHDYLVANSKLDYNASSCPTDDNESNICNVGKTMNQLGFANTYSCLLGIAGIESEVIRDKYSNYAENAINLLKIDNTPYWVSCGADSYISQVEGKNKIRRYFFLRNNTQLDRSVWEDDAYFAYHPSKTIEEAKSTKYEGVRWPSYRKALDYKNNEIKLAGSNKTIVRSTSEIKEALLAKKDYVVDVIDPNSESAYELDEFCKKVIAKYIKPGMSEAEKALEIHDFICSNFVRTDNAMLKARPKITNSEYDIAWGHYKTSLLSGIGDCWGATASFNTLCAYVGIETQGIMAGQVENPYALSGSHQWSFVKIDGLWYNCDCEGADYWEYGKVDRTWFLYSDKAMNLGENKVQPCTSTKYDNYKWPEFKGVAYYQDKTGITEGTVKATSLWIRERDEAVTGKEYSLMARVFPYGSNSKITYSSSNPKVATVNTEGVINVLASGTTTITAKVDGITKSFTLKCGAKPKSIAANDMTLTVGQSKGLTFTANPTDSIYGVEFFRSSDKNVATVDENTGVVTAVGEGTCTISFQYYYKSGTTKYISSGKAATITVKKK